MVYRKLKRVWSHNDANLIPGFREAFPELNKLSSEDLCDRFISLNIDFYQEKETRVKPLIRLTMPFAFLVMLLMFIFIPVKFLFTGAWFYSISSTPKIYNWFRSLKLII